EQGMRVHPLDGARVVDLTEERRHREREDSGPARGPRDCRTSFSPAQGAARGWLQRDQVEPRRDALPLKGSPSTALAGPDERHRPDPRPPGPPEDRRVPMLLAAEGGRSREARRDPGARPRHGERREADAGEAALPGVEALLSLPPRRPLTRDDVHDLR